MLIEDKALNHSLRESMPGLMPNAGLAMGEYLANYCRVIERLTGENPARMAVRLDLKPPAHVLRKTRPAKPARRVRRKAATVHREGTLTHSAA